MDPICVGNTTSSNRRIYVPTKPEQYAKKAEVMPQSDVGLISGHFMRNLTANGLPLINKTWREPKLKNEKIEDYKDFLKRLCDSKNKYYDIFFATSPVQYDTVEDVLKDSLRSTYQNCYSQNEFASVHEITRLKRRKMDMSVLKSHLTSYDTYYSLINELSGMRELSKPIEKKYDRKQLQDELIEIYKTGPTIYYKDICIPAREQRKKFLPGQIKESPMDRYKYRRV